MQRITIQKLGPIKKIDFIIKRTGIIIGEQAIGKSTVAKAIYFSRFMKTIVRSYLIKVADKSFSSEDACIASMKSYLCEYSIREFKSLFGYLPQTCPDILIKYEFDDLISITFQTYNCKDENIVSIQLSKTLENTLTQLINTVIEFSIQEEKNDSVEDLRHLKQDIRKMIRDKTNSCFCDYKDTYFIPAGRSIVTIFSGNREAIIESSDPIMRRYLGIVEIIQRYFRDGIDKVDELIKVKNEDNFNKDEVVSWIKRILKADYHYQQNKEYLVLNEEDKEILISYASSGQQEIIWVLNFLYILLLRCESAFIILEEPEVHLYPSLQDELIRFLLFFQNYTKSTVLMTTHSPYVLTSINSFYCAGVVLEKHEDNYNCWHDRLVKLLGSDSILKPSHIHVIKINTNGEISDLIMRSINEIETEKIDDVSDLINYRYESIYKMDFNNQI